MSIHQFLNTSAISFNTFIENWNDRANHSMKGLTVEERKTLMHRKYNLDRRQITLNQYTPSDDLKHVLRGLTKNLYWFVITEDWCVDSSYNLAVIEKIASFSNKIHLKIIERDKDTTVIDRYLTHGGRAIPILISINEEDAEMFKWGPRPQNQIDYRASLVEQGIDKPQITNKIIEAYDNGAWLAIENEILHYIKNSI